VTSREQLAWRAGGLLVSACIAGAAVYAWRPAADIGYVQINTVPVAPVTQAALYLDATKLRPIRQGGALLRPAGRRADAAGRRPRRQHGAALRYRGPQEPHHHGDGLGAGNVRRAASAVSTAAMATAPA